MLKLQNQVGFTVIYSGLHDFETISCLFWQVLPVAAVLARIATGEMDMA
jgi:hypothetical protein